MGAEVFMEVGIGKNAREAFNAAVKQAQYDFGHAGYTGTIAEKQSYTVIPPLRADMTDDELYDYADELIDKADSRVDDKWGPAGCLKLSGNKYLFFGWASS